MANFESAFLKTIGHEGGYANDPVDTGGETYRGISRVSHPAWPGWGSVDRVKEANARGLWSPAMAADEDLQRLVRSFYESTYWHKIRGDELQQELAEVIFDMYVNMNSTIRYVQRMLNVLTGAGLSVDGVLGNMTLRALTQLDGRDAAAAVILLRCLRGVHYLERCEAHLEQRRFLRGWLKRI